MSLPSHTPRIRKVVAAVGGFVLMIALGIVLYRSMSDRSTLPPGETTIIASALEGEQTIKIARTSPLLVRLPSAVFAETFTDHVSIQPELSGRWSLDETGHLATFNPVDALQEDKVYTVTVKPNVQTTNRAPLGKELLYRFITVGPPIVSARQPAPSSTNIGSDQRILITFDRPMVPLTTVHHKDDHQPTKGLSIDPPTNGSWRWLSTSTVEFRPEHGLAMATYYTVSVAEGMTSAAGIPTEEEFTWQFATERPRIVTTEPFNEFNQAGSERQVVLQLNHGVSKESIKQQVSLIEMKQHRMLTDQEIGAARLGRLPANVGTVRPYTVVYGKNDYGRDNTSQVVLIPDQPLKLFTWYAVVANTGIISTEGSLESNRSHTLHFRTADRLKVTDARYEYGEIWVRFNNVLQEASFNEAVTLTDAQGQNVLSGSLNVDIDQWNQRSLSLYPTLKPSSEYTLTIAGSVQDEFDQALGEPYRFTFQTDPIRPQLRIESRGDFGIFERDKPPVYHVHAVNVSNVELELAKLSLNDFLDIRRRERDQWDFEPSLQKYPQYHRFDLGSTVKQDIWEHTAFDLQEQLGSPLQSGVYVLTAKAPEYTDPWDEDRQRIETQYFVLSNLGVTLKYTGTDALVWVTDLQSGAPVSDAIIVFHTLNGNNPIRGKTDQEGLFQTSVNLQDFVVDYDSYSPEFWVTAQKDGDFAFVGSNWFDGIRPWHFGLSEDFRGADEPPLTLHSFLTTDRPLYKAGDTVHFKGTLRLRNLKGELVIPNADTYQAHVVVRDAEGNEFLRNDFSISEFGSVSGRVPLDSQANLGHYSLSLELTPDQRVRRNYSSKSFQVAAYRKPEFLVEIETSEDNYTDGAEVQATLSGQYFVGAPMPGAAVEWRASTSDYFFNKVTDGGWYSFSLEDSWCGWWESCEESQSVLTEGEGTLNENGMFDVAFPVNLDQFAVSQIVSIDATVSDQNNQTVSSRVSVPVHKAPVYVGIRADDSIVQPGDEAQISVITVQPDGSPMPRQSVQLTLYERTWNTIRKEGVDGDFYYENEPEDTDLSQTSVTTDRLGKTTTNIVIPSGGQYWIKAEAKRGGKTAAAGTSVYAWSSTYINWGRGNHDRIEIVNDKPEYQVGDTAKLLVKSPFQGSGVTALVSIEREQILEHRRINITSTAQVIDVPITEDMIPNVYVSVVVLKPRQGETFDEQGKDTGIPAFKVGYTELNIETSSKDLQIDILPDKEKYLPGETVVVDLATLTNDGRPVPAELSLAVVDMSVLSLAGYRLPRILETFYSDRGLGVRTAQMLLYLIERYKPGSKGGGGGDLASKERSNFKDTAYWNADIVTDERGQASVSFTLPDNLTTWKFIALGSSKDHRFGGQTVEVIETKNVIVRPVRPRFVVHGDTVELAALVHNSMEKEQKFTVTLTGSGFTANQRNAQSVWIKPGTQKKVLFPVTIDRTVEDLHITFMAQSEAAVDRIRERIPVYAYGVEQSVATSGFTSTAVSEQLFVPPSNEATDVHIESVLSPTLASFLPEGLEYVVNYPYGCTEQTVSSFLPNVAVSQLQNFDAFAIVSEDQLETNVIAGLERLYNFQRFDGGFGYWNSSQKSYPYLTAYVLYALQRTQDAGYAVDSNVMLTMRNYLSSVLREQNLNDELSLAERAYILFVLKEGGSLDIALLNNLEKKRDELPLFSQAQLAMAYSNTDDARKAVRILRDVLNHAKLTPRGAHFEEEQQWRWQPLMHTNTRTTAIVLQALIRIDPNHPLIPKIVRWLLMVRENGHWDTTQSSTETILALAEFLKSTGELDASYEATISLNGGSIAKIVVDASNVLQRKRLKLSDQNFTVGDFNELTFSKEGEGRLYYDVAMSYFWHNKHPAIAEEGIGITRSIEPIEGGANTLTTNSVHKVRLSITVPEDRHFVAIESPLPAGFEAVDFSFATTDKRLEEEVEQDDDWQSYWRSDLWRFDHKEFRDDRVFLFADYLPPGVYEYEYLVRVTLPGTYHQRPAKAWMMYRPEVFGQTEGKVVKISN